jgi:adenylosuccinate lyase
MVYKRNPIKSERLCSLCRKLIGLNNNFQNTYINQWLERTLDDSAIRRMDIPEAFLLTDAILDLTNEITRQDYDNTTTRPLTFYPNKIKKILDDEMPFLVTEKIIIDLVKT